VYLLVYSLLDLTGWLHAAERRFLRHMDRKKAEKSLIRTQSTRDFANIK